MGTGENCVAANGRCRHGQRGTGACFSTLLRRSDLLINRREHAAVIQEKLRRFLWTLVPWSTQTKGARLEITVRGGAEQMAPNDLRQSPSHPHSTRDAAKSFGPR